MHGRRRARSLISVVGAAMLASALLSASRLGDPAAVNAAGDPHCSTGSPCVTLHVTLTGPGEGTVWVGDTSGTDNGTISCGRQNGLTLGTCAWEYEVVGTLRTLWVSADPKLESAVCSSGSCTTGRRTVPVELTAGTKGGSIGFDFEWVNPVNVAISRTGNGQGTVNSSPAGISCGTVCSYDFASGRQVSIVPHPATGSEVIDVTVGGTSCWIELYALCNVTPDHNITVIVTFGIKATPAPQTPPPPSATPGPSSTPASTPQGSTTPRPSSSSWAPPPSVRPGSSAKPTLAPDETVDPMATLPASTPEPLGSPPIAAVTPTPFPSVAAASAYAGAGGPGGSAAIGPIGGSSPTSSGGGLPIWIPIVLGSLLLGFGGSAWLVQRAAARR